ncbi:MAG: FAD-dependent oxidoreductase [Rhizomicrobium sp.]
MLGKGERMDHIDMLVIGSGPAGRRAAVQSAKLGKSVLVVDRGKRLGGVSVHTGTIPSKTLRETVLNLSGWRERGFYGRGYRVKQTISSGDLVERLQKTLDHEVEVLQHQFMRNTVRSLFAAAKFLGPNRVQFTTDAGEVSEADFDHALIASGTHPHRPHNVPFDGKRVLDSDEILTLEHLPRTLTVIGGGVIGVEYSTIFSALDVPVTLIEPRDTILDFVDREIVDDFIHQMRDRGMTIRLGSAGERDCLWARLCRGDVGGRTPYAVGNAAVRGRPFGQCRGAGTGRPRYRSRQPRPFEGRSAHLSNQRAAYLCRGRYHRLSQSRLDLDGAGPRGRVPRVQDEAAAVAGDVSLWHLCGAGDFHRRPIGRAGARQWYRL